MYHFLGKIVEQLLGAKWKYRIKEMLWIIKSMLDIIVWGVLDIYDEIRLRRRVRGGGSMRSNV